MERGDWFESRVVLCGRFRGQIQLQGGVDLTPGKGDPPPGFCVVWACAFMTSALVFAIPPRFPSALCLDL